MPKLYEANNLTVRGKLIPFAEFVPFAGTPAANKEISAPNSIAAAEAYLGKPVPELPATLYMEYYRNGNRANYEGPYFARRAAATTLLTAELTEGKGRFTDLLVDYIWAICEESTWVIPAHNHPDHGNPINCLPDAFMLDEDDDVRNIDLFSAMTGAAMAYVWYFGGKVLDPVTPVIRSRLKKLIEKRIFHGYLNDFEGTCWWKGNEGRALNNWTPWIVSNVLFAIMLCESDDGKREEAVVRSVTYIDRFTKDYPSDGGCDEGPSYWGVAGASYFDCVELISELTGGSVSLVKDPFLRRMCEYIADFNLCGNIYANFADAPHILGCDSALLARMGRVTGSDKLTAMAARNDRPRGWHHSHTLWRAVMNMYEPAPEPLKYDAPDFIFYEGLCVMIARNAGGMVTAVKGGHNAESHNHNDVGSFILFKNCKPVFVDPGVETYCKDTFSSKRYTLWAMRSLCHNLPEINGCEQKPGRTYHAELLSCSDRCFSVELKAAYPSEAEIISYIRTVKLDDEGFLVADKVKLGGDGSFVLSLMCSEEPKLSDGSFTLPDAGVNAVYCGYDKAEVDTFPLDPKLTREWSTDRLHRVRLFGKADGETVFTLKAK